MRKTPAEKEVNPPWLERIGPDPIADPALEATLCDAIVREMLIAIGRAPDGPARRLLGPLLRPPAARFVRLMAGADACVARSGMAAGARWLLPHLVQGVDVRGATEIPASGPVLIASNHPGAYDSVAIIANLPSRPDLMVLASDVPFLHHLSAVSAHLIFVPPELHQRMGAIRAMIRHLQAGGALLTFASGVVDPDPDLLPGAHEAVETWYPSLALALRRVPETQVVVTIVSSVVARRYLRSPIVRLAPGGWRRRKLAEFLQISTQLIFSRQAPLIPRVSFAAPIAARDLPARADGPITIAEVITRAQRLLAVHMEASPR